jgi:hypothetical protein
MSKEINIEAVPVTNRTGLEAAGGLMSKSSPAVPEPDILDDLWKKRVTSQNSALSNLTLGHALLLHSQDFDVSIIPVVIS